MLTTVCSFLMLAATHADTAPVRDWDDLSRREQIAALEQSVSRLQSNPEQNKAAIESHQTILKKLRADRAIDAQTRQRYKTSFPAGGGSVDLQKDFVKSTEEMERSISEKAAVHSQVSDDSRADQSMPKSSSPSNSTTSTMTKPTDIQSSSLMQGAAAERTNREEIMKTQRQSELFPANAPVQERYKDRMRTLESDRVNTRF